MAMTLLISGVEGLLSGLGSWPSSLLLQAGGDSEGVLTTLGQLVLNGGPLMVPIGLASILMVGVAFERAWALRRSQIVPADTWSRAEEQLSAGKVDLVRRDVEPGESPVARMLRTGLIHWEEPRPEFKRGLEDAGQREADRLQKNLGALQGIASVAPLLGLLGTVLGMIQSFFTVAQEQALGNPELLAEGIGEALVTTAAGLSVAIPSLVLFLYFRGRVRGLVNELDEISQRVQEIHRQKQRLSDKAA